MSLPTKLCNLSFLLINTDRLSFVPCRFIHRFHMDNGLLNEVDRRSDLIDDDTGNRTIRAVDNVQGVVRFEWTYNKGQANALSTTPENDWIDGGLSLNTEITETLVDGQSIVFFVRAYDAVGNSMVSRIYFSLLLPKCKFLSNSCRSGINLTKTPI